MLTIIKAKFFKIEHKENITFISFIDTEKNKYISSINNIELIRLNKIINFLENNDMFIHIVFHKDCQNIPFLIIDNKILNFTGDFLYDFKNIKENYFFQALYYSFLLSLYSVIITGPLSYILTYFSPQYFGTLFLGWEFFLFSFSFSLLKKYFRHGSFITKKLKKQIRTFNLKNSNFIHCDF